MRLKEILKRFAFRVIPGLNELRAEIHGMRCELASLSDDLEGISNSIDQAETNQFLARDIADTKRRFREVLGYSLDLDNPRTFNEKLTWLKFYFRDPVMSVLVDKYAVRSYLESLGLQQYLNELIDTFSTTDELIASWDRLPNSFVVKPSHYSGVNAIVRDKKNYDIASLARIERALRQNYYFAVHHGTSLSGYKYRFRCREWPYRDVAPRLVVEKYLEDDSGELRDFKVFCFNGRPRYIQVHFDRFSDHTQSFYDTKWRRQEFTTTIRAADRGISRPEMLDVMLDVAAKLAQGFPFVRVDFYLPTRQTLVFGEVTFFHHGGMARFWPREWDLKLGNLLILPQSSCETEKKTCRNGMLEKA